LSSNVASCEFVELNLDLFPSTNSGHYGDQWRLACVIILLPPDPLATYNTDHVYNVGEIGACSVQALSIMARYVQRPCVRSGAKFSLTPIKGWRMVKFRSAVRQ